MMTKDFERSEVDGFLHLLKDALARVYKGTRYVAC